MFDCIDYIVIFDEQKTDSLLNSIKPDIFLKGSNYKGQKIAEQKTLDKINCAIQFIDID